MNISIKATLLSALVIPGAGHLFLNKVWTGLGYLMSALLLIFYLVSTYINASLEIIAKIKSSKIPIEKKEMIEMMTIKYAELNNNEIWIASVALTVIWLTAMVHSYILGCQQDRKRIAKRT